MDNNGQVNLDFGASLTAGDVLERIRNESRDESEKGQWFEQLFMRVAVTQPEFEIDAIWRWRDWPEREELTELDGRDIGIDLVARRNSGEFVAIQCKCYGEKQILRKGEIDKFLGGSQQPVFALRWIVATCRWGENAEKAIRNAYPQVSQIDFRQLLNVKVDDPAASRPVQKPWPLQVEAIEDVVNGLSNHDRGRLVMACGTGKTFTALRVAEEIVEDGHRILFAAPSIALVAQARREWLRHTQRPLSCIVVCSDQTSGGRSENEDIRISELECPVSTDPETIAELLKGDGATRVVFCTYHSLGRVTEAQADYGASAFALAIADEAHRTTGAIVEGRKRKIDFREFHDGEKLDAHKRLYMTATPRIYTQRSKKRLADQGVEVIDMGNFSVYGPELHRLTFKKAVNHEMLSDYRVIVLGLSGSSVTPGLRRRLENIDVETKKPWKAPTTNEMTRVLGIALAVNGVTEGKTIEQPGKLPRTMAFCNSIARSKWFEKALAEPEVLRATTRRLSGATAMRVQAKHLDASSSALQRNQELRALESAAKDGECRIVCNVKLFTEGVDVPSLNAVAFLDPRDSQVDVVQAVGRVMRKVPGKKFGYIVVPVVIEPGKDVASALEKGTEGFQTVGRVLRALQSHDGRLAESPASFVKVYEPKKPPPSGNGAKLPNEVQIELDLKEAELGIYAHVAAASGLGRPGKIVADEISDAVKWASAILQEEGMEDALATALDLVPEDDGGAKGICTVAALMLCNACLLQRRLRDEPGMEMIVRLDAVAGASNPREELKIAWNAILQKDYAPIFHPALSVLRALQEGRAINDAVRGLAECANRVADSLSELGYDHAGPLYHQILGSAKSDGAFYTNNLSAIMLSRLALGEKYINWSDAEAYSKLRIMDPACGTGTLLMASLRTIKSRIGSAQEMKPEEHDNLHRNLVENVICGLDVNHHAVQLAACNLTLGAPTVDYSRMNLVVMPHGPMENGTYPAGSLELINVDTDQHDLLQKVNPRQSLTDFDGEQLIRSKQIGFPLQSIDAVIMNPPFTDNKKRGRKFGKESVRGMQAREIEIRDLLQKVDLNAASAITTNSISTFFTPLADKLLNNDSGVLAKVVPATACVGASSIAERKFLASRFHIERIVTTHDPKRINFSENTTIHECLLICRRWPHGERPPTKFISLRRMPNNVDEAIEAVDAIADGNLGDWGKAHSWPAERVLAGDWTPVQWYDGTLAEIAANLDRNPLLEPAGRRYDIGPDGRRIQDAYSNTREKSPDGIPGFHSVSGKLRRHMVGEPDVYYLARPDKRSLALKYANQKSHLLVPMRLNTVSGRLSGLWTEQTSFGWWVPMAVDDEDIAKALATWWNSTPARLMLLNRRAKTLTYPTWQVAHLREIRIPKSDNPAWSSLRMAFDEACQLEMLPMKHAMECKARKIIDDAAALVLSVDQEAIEDWRRRLSAEPTVTNQRAK
ncbi:MAG: DEAD/DEAH box helicase family protein [Gammaproteobacteria bacterium]|nr:DEAD/DEAH box helicase family protein [Gammaproteobacteria bacterium]